MLHDGFDFGMVAHLSDSLEVQDIRRRQSRRRNLLERFFTNKGRTPYPPSLVESWSKTSFQDLFGGPNTDYMVLVSMLEPPYIWKLPYRLYGLWELWNSESGLWEPETEIIWAVSFSRFYSCLRPHAHASRLHMMHFQCEPCTWDAPQLTPLFPLMIWPPEYSSQLDTRLPLAWVEGSKQVLQNRVQRRRLCQRAF